MVSFFFCFTRAERRVADAALPKSKYYRTVLEVASPRPALIASSLPLKLRCGPAHRRTLLAQRIGLRIGLRLRGSAPVARRRVAVLLADVRRHHWAHANRVSHPRSISAPVIPNLALHLTPCES